MTDTIIHKLHSFIQKRNLQLVEGKSDLRETVEKRTVNMHKKRGALIVRSYVEGDVIRSFKLGDKRYVDYCQRNERLIKLKDTLYLEEHLDFRRAFFEGGCLVKDEESPLVFGEEAAEKIRGARPTAAIKNSLTEEREENSLPQGDMSRFAYNRQEAVRYAERWWNDYNPVYKRFTDNCTNFISQCLRAGGAPMTGYPNREKGWWFQGSNWSFSWSVAHSFRWHLSGATSGLRGEERENARDLQPGDVICYDFDGDGRWQHSTIVVAYDANREPLVNAQTSNSRMRFWTYEDSTAWTPNIQYKFFHIGS